jgi:hypothetical protein
MSILDLQGLNLPSGYSHGHDSHGHKGKSSKKRNKSYCSKYHCCDD